MENLYSYKARDEKGALQTGKITSSSEEAAAKELLKMQLTPIEIISTKQKTKLKLNITLISDTEKEIHNKYKVWRLKKFMGRETFGTIRTTFIIDTDGKIVHIWDKVRVKGHVEEVLEKVKKLKIK